MERKQKYGRLKIQVDLCPSDQVWLFSCFFREDGETVRLKKLGEASCEM